MMRFDSRPPCGPAASSSDPTLPALAASEPAPAASAPLPTSVCDAGPGLIFLLLQPALHSARATMRMISIFRIPYSTLLPLLRQQFFNCKKSPAALFARLQKARLLRTH